MQTTINSIEKSSLESMTDDQLDEMYVQAIGYRPIKDDGLSREDTISILLEYFTEHGLPSRNAPYKEKIGCQSPEQTTEIFEALKAAGFNPIDTTWHNDASDSVEVEIKDKKFRVWVGDPKCEDEYYQANHLVIVDPHSNVDDQELQASTIQEIIAKLESFK